MVVSFIRQDKNFESVSKQLKSIKTYALSKNLEIDDTFIDYNSQNKRLENREDVTKYLREKQNAILLVYDVWVLSTFMEDLVQMFSCLLKNSVEIHFVSKAVVVTNQTSSALVLGLLDGCRRKLQNKQNPSQGRPKGSVSKSKFDIHINKIINLLFEGKSVSYIARELDVSRSSLKDYIESRELKELIGYTPIDFESIDGEWQVLQTINCPK